MKLCTDVVPHRCLVLDGFNGHVVCIVYGKNRASTLYRFSSEWKLESATSTLLRMNNLIVCRGDNESNIMIGPCDYFGSLENIKNKCYSIKIDNDIISFYIVEQSQDIPSLPKVESMFNTNGVWTSHCLENSKQSLFPKPGILKFNTQERIIYLQALMRQSILWQNLVQGWLKMMINFKLSIPNVLRIIQKNLTTT